MKKSAFIIIITVCFGISLAAGGCKDEEEHLCDKVCDPFFEAEEDYADEYCSGFDDDDEEVLSKCVAACKDEWEDLSSNDQDDVDACVTCVIDELGSGSVDYGDIEEAIDDCDDECDDDDIGDFISDMLNEWFGDIDYDECSYE